MRFSNIATIHYNNYYLFQINTLSKIVFPLKSRQSRDDSISNKKLVFFHYLQKWISVFSVFSVARVVDSKGD